MSFNWKDATVEELAIHIATIPSAHTQSQLDFYNKKSKNDVVRRIELAKKLAVAYRLKFRSDKLFEKLNNELGDEIANSNPKKGIGMDRREQGGVE